MNGNASLNIRVGFSTSNAWYSTLIRKVTKAKCSHAFLIMSVLGQDLVFEEGVTGYSTRTLENMEKSGSTIVQVVVPKVDLTVGMTWSLARLGQRYDYAGLFGMAWVMFWRALKKKVHNPLASNKAMFCSEEVTRVLQESGFPGSEKLDPPTTDPESLRLFLVNGSTPSGGTQIHIDTRSLAEREAGTSEARNA